METGQALDHEPGPAVRVKKKQRDRLTRLAAAHSGWVLGFADEVWWSRLAQPDLHAWADHQPVRLREMILPKKDADPVESPQKQLKYHLFTNYLGVKEAA